MASIISTTSIIDSRGELTVWEHHLPFEVRRLFYIHNVPENSVRGGHRHHSTRQLAVCISGSCAIDVHDGKARQSFLLKTPDQGLLLEPEDFHWMKSFTPGAILLVLASTTYDKADYITAEYN